MNTTTLNNIAAGFTWTAIAAMKEAGLNGREIADSVMHQGADPIRGSDLARKAIMMVNLGRGEEVYCYKGRATASAPVSGEAKAKPETKAVKAGKPGKADYLSASDLSDRIKSVIPGAFMMLCLGDTNKLCIKAAFEGGMAEELLHIVSRVLTPIDIEAVKAWAGVETPSQRQLRIAAELATGFYARMSLEEKNLETSLELYKAGWTFERPAANKSWIAFKGVCNGASFVEFCREAGSTVIMTAVKESLDAGQYPGIVGFYNDNSDSFDEFAFDTGRNI